jgi:CDP-paratose synthetase
MTFKKKTILITGATGYLGRQICFKLAAAQANIIAVKQPSSNTSVLSSIEQSVIFYDYTDQNSLTRIFEQHPIDLIIHCATNYNTHLTQATISEYSNVLLPLSLLEMALTRNKPAFINVDTILDAQISIYAFTKKHFADWLKFFAKDIACINVSLSQFYGPFDNPTRFCAKVISDLLLNTSNIDLTPGEQRRDFIHISDVVDAILLLTHSYLGKILFRENPGFYQYNIGTGINTCLRDFVCLAKQITGNTTTRLNFGAVPYRTGEVFEYQPNLDPIFSLGWKPKFDLVSGLTDTIKQEIACSVGEKSA